MKLQIWGVLLVLAALALIFVFSSKVFLSPEVPFGYSPPVDVFNNDEPIFFLEDVNSGTIRISVSHGGAYVYKYGYYWKPSEQAWVRYTFPQITFPNTNWIPEDTFLDLNLANASLSRNNLYMVAYSCKKYGSWKCGCRTENDCGYWMYQTTVTNQTRPPRQQVPGENLTFYNATGKIAIFSSSGDILLRGICTRNNTCNPSGEAFVFKKDSGEVISYIDLAGNLCIEGRDCNAVSNSPLPCNVQDDSFIIRNNNGNPVIVLNNSGALCITGTLTQSVNII